MILSRISVHSSDKFRPWLLLLVEDCDNVGADPLLVRIFVSWRTTASKFSLIVAGVTAFWFCIFYLKSSRIYRFKYSWKVAGLEVFFIIVVPWLESFGAHHKLFLLLVRLRPYLKTFNFIILEQKSSQTRRSFYLISRAESRRQDGFETSGEKRDFQFKPEQACRYCHEPRICWRFRETSLDQCCSRGQH